MSIDEIVFILASIGLFGLMGAWAIGLYLTTKQIRFIIIFSSVFILYIMILLSVLTTMLP